MYRTIQGPLRGWAPQDDGLGFSLKPPKWLRNAVSKAVGIVTQGQAAVDAVNTNYDPGAGRPQNYGNEMPSWVLPVGLGVVAFLLLNKRGRG